MAARPTRRVVLAVVLSAVTAPPAVGAIARPDPLAAAIRRARLADAAHRQAGQDTLTVFGPNAPRPAYWRAYRFGVLAERYSARHALTPATPDEASALVAYYAERAELSADPETARAGRRRLRKVFARPGAAPAPPLPPALRPPAPS